MEVKLPFLVEGVEECTVSFWQIDEGDTVELDDDLLECSTSKAVFNVPAPVAGKVVEVIVSEGDVIKVGDVICIIEEA